jgi:hypothetical protein
MVYVDQVIVDTFANKVGSDVNVFHAGVRLWVMSASYSALIVTVEWGRALLREKEFLE